MAIIIMITTTIYMAPKHDHTAKKVPVLLMPDYSKLSYFVIELS